MHVRSREFTVSYARPDMVVQAGLAATARMGDGSKPRLAALATFPAEVVDCVLVAESVERGRVGRGEVRVRAATHHCGLLDLEAQLPRCRAREGEQLSVPVVIDGDPVPRVLEREPSVGEGAHAEDEHVVVPRMPERAALLALVLLAPTPSDSDRQGETR